MAPTPIGDRVWRWGTWVADPPEETAIGGKAHISLLQFNVCGSHCNKGGVEVVDAMIRSIQRRPADVVILNELCLAQADDLWTKLKSRGLAVSGCFGASTGISRCPGEPNEGWYGNAVFSAGVGIGAPELHPLPTRPEAHEQRNATSMRSSLQGRDFHLSSVHLSPRSSKDDYNRRQIAEVARLHNARVKAGEVVVLGGDFNVTADHLRSIYEPAGMFREVDYPLNSATYKNRKIDYIFLSRPHFEGLSGKVTQSKFSDHRPLLGEATLRN